MNVIEQVTEKEICAILLNLKYTLSCVDALILVACLLEQVY